MPEGHTIHRLAERHRKLLAGRPVAVSSPQGRFASDASRIDGQVLLDTEAHGKHLLHHYAGGETVHVHLGRYGKFTDGDAVPPPPVGEVRLRMLNDEHWLDLRGPAACELLDPARLDVLHARLGPDPLAADSDGDSAYRIIKKSGRPLMALLMDQSIVAGAGLIYVTEALFRAGLPPTATGKRLTRRRWHGGEVYVYRRTGQPCLVCGSPVRTAVLNARNAYWCPRCQKAG